MFNILFTKNTIFLVFISVLVSACAVKPKGAYIPPQNLKVDYSNADYWAALPDRQDEADHVPKGFNDQQKIAQADVFWLYPTTYTGKKGQDQWYPTLEDEYTNNRTDATSIKYQATIFNEAGRVFAPRYRQMHLHGFYAKKEDAKKEGAKAYEQAYQDVKAAFEYYLKNWNDGRPIIIAGHSQGAGHSIRLVKEMMDGTALQEQFVAAYLVGWPVKKDEFKTIKVCESPTAINCFCSWRTFKNGHFPNENVGKNGEYSVTNPLSWETNEKLVPQSENLGGILLDLNKIYPSLADAQVKEGILWTHKPKFKGSFLIWRKNYHVADMNFFYLNVRENAKLRVQAFLRE